MEESPKSAGMPFRAQSSSTSCLPNLQTEGELLELQSKLAQAGVELVQSPYPH